jgi:hypothetical protein
MENLGVPAAVCLVICNGATTSTINLCMSNLTEEKLVKLLAERTPAEQVFFGDKGNDSHFDHELKVWIVTF